jgi:hypothetical protein
MAGPVIRSLHAGGLQPVKSLASPTDLSEKLAGLALLDQAVERSTDHDRRSARSLGTVP